MHKLPDTIFRSLLKKDRSCYIPALLLTFIHPRVWKVHHPESTFTNLYSSSLLGPGILHKHGRFLLGLEKHPRPQDAWGSGARDATQRSARARRPARLLLPAILLPISHLPRFPDGLGDRKPRGRPEEPVRGLVGALASDCTDAGGRLRRSHAAHREHRRARPRNPGRPVAGPGRLHLHHQGGEPLLPPRGEPAVLAVARHLPAHNLGIYATHRGPDPRGVQRRSLRLGYSRAAGRRHEPREALELGHGLRRHHSGPRCALLPGPRREAAVQVDHAGWVYGDHSAVLS